jgi:hypothetical protein
MLRPRRRLIGGLTFEGAFGLAHGEAAPEHAGTVGAELASGPTRLFQAIFP